MRRLMWILVLALLAGLPAAGQAPAEAQVYFEMEDPSGDDYGPGTYHYPRSEAFAPYSGLFDLTRFRVWGDSPESEDVIFDLTFSTMSNPWAAPEGFIHQLINIYIDTKPNGGRIETLKPGAMVRFPPDQGWEVFVRGAGWEGSACFFVDAGGGIASGPVHASLQPDGHTVRLRVPRQLIGTPQPEWGYYVLIGAYDGFGPDNFRAVNKETGEWSFGGGLDQDVESNIIDMLAPRGGKRSQERQLRSYDSGAGECAIVYPVRKGEEGIIPAAGLVAGGLILLAGIGYLVNRFAFKRRIPRIFQWHATRK